MLGMGTGRLKARKIWGKLFQDGKLIETVNYLIQIETFQKKVWLAA